MAGCTRHYGIRHRAALGLSERTDAVCLIVSEERSEVSTITEGEIITWDTPSSLAGQLTIWLGVPDSPVPAFKDFLKGTFIENWRQKMGALGLVVVAWLVLASQQEVNISIAAQIQYLNKPGRLVLDKNSAKTVDLKLTGRRSSLKALNVQDVRVHVDLYRISAGNHLIKLVRKNIDLPVGVKVDKVTPQEIGVVLKSPQNEIEDIKKFK